MAGEIPNPSLRASEELFPDAIDIGISPNKHASGDRKKISSRPFHLFQTDPSQEKALRKAVQGKSVIIDGRQGTGKRHLLAALVSNILSRHGKALVLSKDVAHLRKVKNKLDKAGIGELCLVFTDTILERGMLTSEFKKNLLRTKESLEFNDDNFELLVSLITRDEAKLEAGHDFLNSNLYQDNTWIEMVGKFLESHHLQSRSLLKSYLGPEGFGFFPEEYQLLKDAISECERLYMNLNTLKHPLEALNDSIFSGITAEEALDKTNKNIIDFEKKAGTLYHNLISLLEDYGQDLRNHFLNSYQNLREKTSLIKDGIKDYIQQYGSDFQESDAITNTKLKFKGLFSKRPQNILETKKGVLDDYHSLKEEFATSAYFPFDFNKNRSGSGFEALSVTLEIFEKSLEEWSPGIHRIVSEKVSKLDQETVQKSFKSYEEQVKSLESSFSSLLEELNESQIFRTHFKEPGVYLKDKLDYLAEIRDLIELVKFNLQDFHKFFPWKHYWLTIEGLPQKLIQALIKVRPTNWQAAFDSWYFHQILENRFSISIPSSGQILRDYATNLESLQQHIKKKTLSDFRNLRKDRSEIRKETDKYFYLEVFSRQGSSAGSSRLVNDLFQKNLDLTLSFFPVLLMTPGTASNLLSGSSDNFESVIFLDAEQLPFRKYAGLLNQGHNKVLFTNSEDFALSAAKSHEGGQSVWEYGKEMNFPEFKLEYYHLPYTPFSDLLNNKIYQSALKRLPASSKIPKVRFIPVSGNYQTKKKINEEELSQTFLVLNEIVQERGDNLPKTGLACFTIQQKEKLDNMIQRVKFEKSTGIKVINQLENAGMRTCLVSELPLMEFDILIFSTVFDGSSMEDLGNELATENGNGLKQICMFPANEFFIITSIEPESLAEFAEANPDHFNLELLAEFLYTANDLSLGLVNFMEPDWSANLPERSDLEKRNRLIIQEIVEAISAYIDPMRLESLVSINGVYVDLVISPLYEKQPGIILKIDGFFSTEKKGTYFWDHTLAKAFEKIGYNIYDCWSVNWWLQPEDEARRLISTVLNLDKQFELEARLVLGDLDGEMPWDTT